MAFKPVEGQTYTGAQLRRSGFGGVVGNRSDNENFLFQTGGGWAPVAYRTGGGQTLPPMNRQPKTVVSHGPGSGAPPTAPIDPKAQQAYDSYARKLAKMGSGGDPAQIQQIRQAMAHYQRKGAMGTQPRPLPRLTPPGPPLMPPGGGGASSHGPGSGAPPTAPGGPIPFGDPNRPDFPRNTGPMKPQGDGGPVVLGDPNNPNGPKPLVRRPSLAALKSL